MSASDETAGCVSTWR